MTGKEESGLDLNIQDLCSKIAVGHASRSFNNRRGKIGAPLLEKGEHFASILDFGSHYLVVSSDGIGTKIEIAERTGKYDSLGFDLTAMAVDDLAAVAAEPVGISNIIDVDFLDRRIIDQLMAGLERAAEAAKIVIAGGEIAEVGDRIGGYGTGMHFNWCATAFGVMTKPANPVTGDGITVGDTVISMRSKGFRSNGFSLIRKIMKNRFGQEWHQAPWKNDKTFGEVLLEPSLIYSPAVVHAIANDIRFKGIAHVTGGGIIGNLKRLLQINGLGADLFDLFEPHDFVRDVQRLGEIDEARAYEYWNMGNGMLLIVDEDDSGRLLSSASELGYEAKTAGRIISESRVTLNSKGAEPQHLIFNI